MPKLEKEIKVCNPQGLHARPAAMFVQIASKYNSEVEIWKDSEKVNGKSIMGILTLGVQKDCVIKLCVDGGDAEPLINELEDLLTKGLL